MNDSEDLSEVLITSRLQDASDAHLLDINVSSCQYWPAGSREEFNREVAQILDALDLVLELDENGRKKHQVAVNEVLISQTAQYLCVLGYSSDLTEAVTTHLAKLVRQNARSLLLVCQNSATSRLAAAAQTWRHFAGSVQKVARILMFLDKAFIKNTILESINLFCVAQFKHELGRRAEHVAVAFVPEVKENLKKRRRELLGLVVRDCAASFGTCSDVDEDMVIVTVMLLDLEYYFGEFQNEMVSGAKEDVRECLAALANKSPNINLLGLIVNRFLVSLLVFETTLVNRHFHGKTAPVILYEELRILLDSAENMLLNEFDPNDPATSQALPIQFSETFKVPIQPISHLEILILKEDDTFLKVLFLSYLVIGIFDDFVKAWTNITQHLTSSFISHFLESSEFAAGSPAVGSKTDEEVISSVIHLNCKLKHLAVEVFTGAPFSSVSLISQTKTEGEEDDLDGQASKPINVAIAALSNIQLSRNDSRDSDAYYLRCDEQLSRVTRETFTAIFALKPHISQKFSRCLIRYVDDLCRVSRAASESETEIMSKIFPRVAELFRALEWKAYMGKLHEDALVKRLFTGLSRSLDVERAFVNLLREECGEGFVSKMAFVIREYETSVKMMQDFAATSPTNQCEIWVSVVPAHAWTKEAEQEPEPTDLNQLPKPVEKETAKYKFDVPVKLPSSLESGLRAYSTFYFKAYENRLLEFKVWESWALLKYNIRRVIPSSGPSILLVTTTCAQALVLLLYDTTRLEIPISEIKDALYPLGEAKLGQTLNKLCFGPRKSAILRQDNVKQSYRLNTDAMFTSHQIDLRSSIFNPDSVSKAEVEAEARASAQAEEVSNVAVDSFIVRHLKAERRATVSQLIARMSEASFSGPVSVSRLKERLDVLKRRGEMLLQNDMSSLLQNISLWILWIPTPFAMRRDRSLCVTAPLGVSPRVFQSPLLRSLFSQR